MIKAIGIMILVNLPFFVIAMVLIYFGYVSEGNLFDNKSRKLGLFVSAAILMGVSFLISFVTLRGAYKQNRKIEEITTHGKRGTAKILKLTDTRRSGGSVVGVELQLEISIPNYPKYVAQKTLMLSVVHLPRVQPGSTVDILADPEDKYNEDRIGLILE
jgi:hypothetical protein